MQWGGLKFFLIKKGLRLLIFYEGIVTKPGKQYHFQVSNFTESVR
jgi:hypothetical protein